jgi:hypothetical protein
MVKKALFTLALSVLGMITSLSLNFLIIQNLLIPDPCIYETENFKTGWLFNFFYEISSNTGYHPEPTIFNIFFTIFIGISLGILTSFKLVWKE